MEDLEQEKFRLHSSGCSLARGSYWQQSTTKKVEQKEAIMGFFFDFFSF